jgi:hypothetical protein
MKHRHLRFGSDFQVVINDKHSQAAQMTLAVGDREGGPKTRHVGADQWLFVVAGVGLAIPTTRCCETDQKYDGRFGCRSYGPPFPRWRCAASPA